jgi:hypothetical protein
MTETEESRHQNAQVMWALGQKIDALVAAEENQQQLIDSLLRQRAESDAALLAVLNRIDQALAKDDGGNESGEASLGGEAVAHLRAIETGIQRLVNDQSQTRARALEEARAEIIVVIFVLMVFVIAQAFLQQQLSSKDRTLAELNRRVIELNQMLGKERDTSAALKAQVATVTANLQATTAERDKLTEASNASAAQVQALSQQIADLTAELQKLNDALGQANAKAQEQTTTIAELTQKLNLALATKVTELAKYRSEFFGKLRAVLGDRADIRIVGDR